MSINLGCTTAIPTTTSGPVVATGIDACLTHARANASDGDTYQDSVSKAYYTYNDSGSGILVPLDGVLFGGNTLTLVPNAAGTAYVTLADAESDVVGRGWVVVESGASASISKSGGSALIITATASGHYCTFTFLPSSAPTSAKKYLLIAKIAVIASPGTGFGTVWLNDGTKQRGLVPDNGGTAGSWAWANSTTPKGTAACACGTAAKWICVYYGASGEPLLVSAMADRSKNSQAVHGDMRASAAADNLYLSVYSNGSACTLHIFEMFLLEVT